MGLIQALAKNKFIKLHLESILIPVSPKPQLKKPKQQPLKDLEAVSNAAAKAYNKNCTWNYQGIVTVHRTVIRH